MKVAKNKENREKGNSQIHMDGRVVDRFCFEKQFLSLLLQKILLQ